jgi:hypothetical protein
MSERQKPLLKIIHIDAINKWIHDKDVCNSKVR